MTDARKTALLERFAPALVEDRAAAAAAAKRGGAPSELTWLTCLVGSTCPWLRDVMSSECVVVLTSVWCDSEPEPEAEPEPEPEPGDAPTRP